MHEYNIVLGNTALTPEQKKEHEWYDYMFKHHFSHLNILQNLYDEHNFKNKDECIRFLCNLNQLRRSICAKAINIPEIEKSPLDAICGVYFVLFALSQAIVMMELSAILTHISTLNLIAKAELKKLEEKN